MNDKHIQKALEQEAQVITERMPSDMAKRSEAMEMTAVQLKRFMVEHNFSQAGIARRIGVSSAAISQFASGKYKGDVKTLINKIINLINSVERKETRPKRDDSYIETTVARKIAALITNTERFSEVEGKIGLIIGDGGHGKSHCLRAYAEANKNTMYIELDDAMTSTLLFAEIAEKLNIDSSGRMATVTRRIIEKLANRQMIIMLDEASGLRVKQLNLLRQVITIKCRCPLILAGNSELLKTVHLPTSKYGRESLDQFTSRLMGTLNLDELANDKKEDLYTIADVRKLYEYGGVRLATDGAAALRKICKTPRSGRLRTCGHIISALHSSKVVKEKRLIDTELIIAAINELDLPVRVWLPLATIRQKTQLEETQTAAVVG